MEKLYFITAHGVCGFSIEWDAQQSDYDAYGWIEKFGDRIGSGTAPLPENRGFIDLSQFASITTER